jgi:hypothetical protein
MERGRAVDKSGDNMGEASYAEAGAAMAKTCSRTIELKLADEVADTLRDLSEQTGMSVESLLETSIGLLRTAVQARTLGRRFVVTTKAWWPIKEFILPRAS